MVVHFSTDLRWPGLASFEDQLRIYLRQWRRFVNKRVKAIWLVRHCLANGYTGVWVCIKLALSATLPHISLALVTSGIHEMEQIVLPLSFHLQDLIEATLPSSPCALAPGTDVWNILQTTGIPFQGRAEHTSVYPYYYGFRAKTTLLFRPKNRNSWWLRLQPVLCQWAVRGCLCSMDWHLLLVPISFR